MVSPVVFVRTERVVAPPPLLTPGSSQNRNHFERLFQSEAESSSKLQVAMNILGINAYHGNASAAIVCDGPLVAAVEEERFNRVKYAAGFPAAAIRYCLKKAGLALSDIDHVAVPRNPYARLARKLFYALRMPSFARGRAKVLLKFQGIPEALAETFAGDLHRIRAEFHRIEHHQAHLASS